MRRRIFLFVAIAFLSGCASSYFRLVSTDGETLGLEQTCRDRYWEFKAGTATIMISSSKGNERFELILWINPTYIPERFDRKSPPNPIPVAIEGNFSELELRTPRRSYRANALVKFTRIPGTLLDDWKVEPLPNGAVSSTGMYKAYFPREIEDVEKFNLAIPPLLIDGKRYTFPPVIYARTEIIQTGLAPCR